MDKIIIIFIIALIYSAIFYFITSKLSFFKSYKELKERYWKEYIKFIKEGLNLSSEEIEQRKNLLNSLLFEQFKLSLVIFFVYILMFGIALLSLNVLAPEKIQDYPYGEFCIVDDKYIYEKGVIKSMDLFQDNIIDNYKGSKFLCEPVLELNFPFLRYLIGNLKIFIFFIIFSGLLINIFLKIIEKIKQWGP